MGRKQSWRRIVSVSLMLVGVILVASFAGIEIYLRTDQVRCDRDDTTYGYCPELNYIRDVTLEDIKYKKVDIFTDKYGGRIPKPGVKTDPKNADVVLIGDAFVQAGAIPYQKTMYGLLSSETNVYALGYLSWNLIQFGHAAKLINAKQATYLVFIGINDFNPNDSRSVYGELGADKSTLSITKRFVRNSKAAVSIYGQAKKIYFQSSENSMTADVASVANSHYEDCSALADVPDGVKRKFGYGFLVYTKHAKCWDNVHTSAVDLAIERIRQIGKYVNEQLQSSVVFFLVPGGWSFEREYTAGRQTKFYEFPPDVRISHRGIAEYIKGKTSQTIVDLEPILGEGLERYRENCPDCTDIFYLKHDGHWTANTHRYLTRWLVDWSCRQADSKTPEKLSKQTKFCPIANHKETSLNSETAVGDPSQASN